MKNTNILHAKSLAELKAIASALGVAPTGDRRNRFTWIEAIEVAEESPVLLEKSALPTDNNPVGIKVGHLDFGTPISFGYTAQYLPQKCVTRRDWKDSHSTKFVNAANRAFALGKNLRVPAIDKAYQAGGKQIGWLFISDRPYKQKLRDMSISELRLEGGMCRSVEEFVDKYFHGNPEKEVWVIRFRFEALQQEKVATENHNLKVLTSSKSDEHYTPEKVIEAAREVMGAIDLDPMSSCCANSTVRATNFYSKEDDGLTKPWFGKVWLNPPFSLADEAVQNLLQAYLVGVVTEACLLLKAAPDTKRHQLLAPFPFCELQGRLKFVAEGNSQPAPFATLVFYLGRNFARFKEVFSRFGNVRLGQNQVDELESDRRELLAKVAQLELELAKKSEAAGQPDRRIDWLEDDLRDRVFTAETKLKAWDLDSNIPQFEILSRQRIEWTARLEELQSLQQRVTAINRCYFGDRWPEVEKEYRRPELEELEGWRPEFAIGKLIQPKDPTLDLAAEIRRFSRIKDDWICLCQIKEKGDSYSAVGKSFYLRATELIQDFEPYQFSQENRISYRLGSVRTAQELKSLFGVKITAASKACGTELVVADGSIWQAFKERNTERCAIKWRCEVLPDGQSVSPRISQKNDRLEAVANPNFLLL